MLALLNELQCQACMGNWVNIPASALLLYEMSAKVNFLLFVLCHCYS